MTVSITHNNHDQKNDYKCTNDDQILDNYDHNTENDKDNENFYNHIHYDNDNDQVETKDALLHAINEEYVEAVEVIINIIIINIIIINIIMMITINAIIKS